MIPRYKLPTLLILLAVLPPLLWFGWVRYQAWKADRDRPRVDRIAALRGSLATLDAMSMAMEHEWTARQVDRYTEKRAALLLELDALEANNRSSRPTRSAIIAQ